MAAGGSTVERSWNRVDEVGERARVEALHDDHRGAGTEAEDHVVDARPQRQRRGDQVGHRRPLRRVVTRRATPELRQHAVHQPEHVVVQEGHGLGSPRRARRERDRGHTRRRRGGVRIEGTGPRPGAVAGRQHDRDAGDARRVAGTGDDRGRPVLVDHVLELPGREARVERHVDAAREPHPEQRGHDVGPVRQHHADGLAGAQPALAQHRGQCFGLRAQLGAGDLLGRGVDGDGRLVALAPVEDLGEAHRRLTSSPAPTTAGRASPRTRAGPRSGRGGPTSTPAPAPPPCTRP